MPFETSNKLLGTLPNAKLSRANPAEQEVHASTLTDLLMEGQRLIQDYPDQAHIDQATKIFRAVGFHAYDDHPAFDRLIIDSAKGLLVCGHEYMQPSNARNESSTSDAQSALIYAADIITNPQFCYDPHVPDQEIQPSRIRPAYADFGFGVRDNICKELLQLAFICAKNEAHPLKRGSFALDCIEWAYRLARRKSGIKVEAARMCATHTQDKNTPEGIDIRSLVGEMPTAATMMEVKPAQQTSTAGVGACAPEVVRADNHHRPAHATSTPTPATVVAHLASPRQIT